MGHHRLGGSARGGQPLTGAGGPVQAVAFSPNGQLLAAGSEDKTVRLSERQQPGQPAPAGKPLTGPTNTVDAVSRCG